MIILLSCRGTKGLTKINKIYSRDEITAAILSHNTQPNTYYAKGEIDLESTEQSISGSFDCRMKKDSIIIISARKLGVEAARLRILPTSYTIVYRLESVYQEEPIQDLRKFIGMDVDFEDMQAMLVNNVILADTSTMLVTKTDLGYQVDGKADDMKVQYTLSPDLQIIKTIYTDIRRQSVTIEMSDYRKLNGHMHAYQRTISADSPQGTGKISLTIETLEVDTYKKLNFSIPAHYEKI